MWVRIPPGHGCLSVMIFCVLSGRGLCDGLIARPEESYRLWCVVVCDLETSRMRRPWPALGRSATKKNTHFVVSKQSHWGTFGHFTTSVNLFTNIIISKFNCCKFVINPLKPELNPICYLQALLGAHHFPHVSRIRVKSLTFRRLMSYIYGAPILDVSRSHTTTQHSR